MRNTYVIGLAPKPDEDAPVLDQSEDRFIRPNHEFIVVEQGKFRTRRFIGDEEEVAVEHELKALLDAPDTDTDRTYDLWLAVSRSHQEKTAPKSTRSERHRHAKRKRDSSADSSELQAADELGSDGSDPHFLPGPDDSGRSSDSSDEAARPPRKRSRRE
jgi:hypothetical protein